jgi:hypothetical protein
MAPRRDREPRSEPGPAAGLAGASGRPPAASSGAPGTPAAIELSLDITDLSALLVGSVSLEALHRFGRAEVSPETAVHILGRLFAMERPTCLTAF